MRDSVLLQARAMRRKGDARPVLCDGKCVSSFDAAGGCAALSNNSHGLVIQIMTSPKLSGCNLDECEEKIFERCFPKEDESFCQKCIATFEAAGGCEAPAESLASHIPFACLPCGEDAMTHCMKKSLNTAVSCEGCTAALDASDGCAMLQGNMTSEMPQECAGVDRACMEEQAVRCGVWSRQGCRTVQRGDNCYGHVMWALSTGVIVEPKWYPGLSQRSSFEDFQRHLHQRNHHDCPLPCESLPATCHTAVPGDECHRHVTWAKQEGIVFKPDAYPATLTRDSPMESFQQWLHHIHHGECFAPCEAHDA